jgi:predicted secreted protein
VTTSFFTSLLERLKVPFKAARPADMRSHRLVAVIECTLNQNVRDAGAACCPAMNFALIELCHQHGVGLLPMPCPEIAALGFPRSRQAGQTIRQALDTKAGRQACAALAAQVAERIGQQLAAGDELLAVLGGNPGSPGCAVHVDGAGLAAESGVFMQELHVELARRGLSPTFRGIRDATPESLAEDLRWLRDAIARP